MKKNYVLDTNVLIHDPRSIFQFEDNNLYIPIYVLEELDKLKTEQSLRGKNSREACKIIDKFRQQGSLPNGVKNNDGILFTYIPKERKSLEVALDTRSMDNNILQCAFEIKNNDQNIKTILITMDVNLRIRAASVGIPTESYEGQAVESNKITGHIEIDIEEGGIDEFYQNSGLRVEDKRLYDNICVTLKEPYGRTGLGRYSESEKEIIPIRNFKEGIMSIKPKNREQQFALDLLLDDNVKLVSLTGIAGSGKTLLSSAVGLQKVMQEQAYNRFLISKPIVPVGGKDLGYLPGTIEEKMNPWVQPIFDNLDMLMMSGGGKRKGFNFDDILNEEIIKIEPLSYVRGRSFSKQFILIDEAQNLNNHELKTIITRCGEGTKIVLTGDPDQVDSPYMNKTNNGLSVAIEKLHGNPLVGHLTLTKGERSKLANLAAERL